MTSKKSSDNGFGKVIDKLVAERAHVEYSEPNDVPDCVWHRVMCGCNECQSKLKKS